MQHKKFRLSALLLLTLGLTGLHAQETISVTGGNATSSGGSVSYSIGQIVSTTNTGSNGSVAQGVQQPFEISVVTGIEHVKEINLNCSAYPNPTTDYLILKVDNYDKEIFYYQLYGMNSKLLENKKVKANETSIVMRNLVPAIYFVKVTIGNKEVKIFKIIKN